MSFSLCDETLSQEQKSCKSDIVKLSISQPLPPFLSPALAFDPAGAGWTVLCFSPEGKAY